MSTDAEVTAQVEQDIERERRSCLDVLAEALNMPAPELSQLLVRNGLDVVPRGRDVGLRVEAAELRKRVSLLMAQKADAMQLLADASDDAKQLREHVRRLTVDSISS